ncbi:MAG TPA: allantoicase [Thermoanaerobaculia bacterium]|nr:allantoicase [Thermoanaerobaculia bacterium]
MSAANFRDFVDLASERLGGSVLYATDDYFAEKENLLKQSAAIWKEHEYTDRGKWMDGWESRRKRVEGHDYAIVRLGAPGVIRGVVIDTAFFRGNYPSHASIEACVAKPETLHEQLANWIEILPKSELKGDSQNDFAIDSPSAFTHLRFHIYPDGGVARLRVHGEVVPDWHREGGLDNPLDLAAIEHGGEVLTCSDMFFGPKHNLIMPGRAFNMSDGWETRRSRGANHKDWVIVQLACEAHVTRVELDTSWFKGNFPDTASLDASRDGESWSEILPRTKMLADSRHIFDVDAIATHIRLNVYPDGGVARMRVYGRATEAGRGAMIAQYLNTLADGDSLRRVCGSSEWVRRMLAARPLRDAFETSDAIWSSLSESDWREAFAAHPRIGEKKGGAWSAEEQSGTRSAAEQTMRELADANRAYEERFGHIYIVCATGKSAGEMLRNCVERLGNPADVELGVAAEEQRKIMHLRLNKLVN